MAPPKGFNKGIRPPAAGIGRKRGSQNKFTRQLKDLILGALAEVGGEAYLVQQARENPATFLTLVGKVLPLQVKAGGEDPTLPPRKIVHIHQPSVPEPVALPPQAVVQSLPVLANKIHAPIKQAKATNRVKGGSGEVRPDRYATENTIEIRAARP